jgi:hypothetical protein
MDEVTPPTACERVLKGAPANGLSTVTYPNARHGFDVRGLPERTDLALRRAMPWYPAGVAWNADVASRKVFAAVQSVTPIELGLSRNGFGNASEVERAIASFGRERNGG